MRTKVLVGIGAVLLAVGVRWYVGPTPQPTFEPTPGDTYGWYAFYPPAEKSQPGPGNPPYAPMNCSVLNWCARYPAAAAQQLDWYLQYGTPDDFIWMLDLYRAIEHTCGANGLTLNGESCI